MFIHISFNNLKCFVFLIGKNMEITYRDLYIQVKRMNLKHPHVFLTLALPHYDITSFTAFGISIFYVSCFLWHYPSHIFKILYAAGGIYKQKFFNSFKSWWEKMNTYSPHAQELIVRYRSNMERCQSMESHDEPDDKVYQHHMI